jgi:hypothetical protein
LDVRIAGRDNGDRVAAGQGIEAKPARAADAVDGDGAGLGEPSAGIDVVLVATGGIGDGERGVDGHAAKVGVADRPWSIGKAVEVGERGDVVDTLARGDDDVVAVDRDAVAPVERIAPQIVARVRAAARRIARREGRGFGGSEGDVFEAGGGVVGCDPSGRSLRAVLHVAEGGGSDIGGDGQAAVAAGDIVGVGDVGDGVAWQFDADPDIDPQEGGLDRRAGVGKSEDVSTIALFDGLVITDFDGVPASASHRL